MVFSATMRFIYVLYNVHCTCTWSAIKKHPTFHNSVSSLHIDRFYSKLFCFVDNCATVMCQKHFFQKFVLNSPLANHEFFDRLILLTRRKNRNTPLFEIPYLYILTDFDQNGPILQYYVNIMLSEYFCKFKNILCQVRCNKKLQNY